LSAGAVGVSNVMAILVAERTHEIGIRRAIGASPRLIVGEVLVESTVLTGAAAALGIGCGVAILEITSRVLSSLAPEKQPIFLLAPAVDLRTVLASAALAVLVGACAGIIPARRALAIRPVEALAHE
jgi:putative ABC transport system permease protein